MANRVKEAAIEVLRRYEYTMKLEEEPQYNNQIRITFRDVNKEKADEILDAIQVLLPTRLAVPGLEQPTLTSALMGPPDGEKRLELISNRIPRKIDYDLNPPDVPKLDSSGKKWDWELQELARVMADNGINYPGSSRYKSPEKTAG